MTAWLTLWSAIFIGFAGLAVDMASVNRMRTMLQATADLAAHAALVELRLNGANDAVAAAVDVGRANMPEELHGATILPEDVTIGTWDRETGSFAAGGSFPNAVRVIARRTAERGNPLPASLLRILDVEIFDVGAAAIAESTQPPCLYDGFVARGEVTLENRNTFGPDLCVHGQAGVRIGSGGQGGDNVFHEPTQVSAPGFDLIHADPSRNTNLTLTAGRLEPLMVDRLPEDIADISSGKVFGEVWPTVAVTGAEFRTLANSSSLQPNTVYKVSCGEQLTLGQAGAPVIADIALVANCRLQIAAQASFSNVTIITTAVTSQAEISFAARQTNGGGTCGSFGAIRLMTYGDVIYASQQSVSNIQIVAGGDVTITTAYNGQGISVQAGGDIAIANDNSFWTCPDAPHPMLTAVYFRLSG